MCVATELSQPLSSSEQELGCPHHHHFVLTSFCVCVCVCVCVCFVCVFVCVCVCVCVYLIKRGFGRSSATHVWPTKHLTLISSAGQSMVLKSPRWWVQSTWLSDLLQFSKLTMEPPTQNMGTAEPNSCLPRSRILRLGPREWFTVQTAEYNPTWLYYSSDERSMPGTCLKPIVSDPGEQRPGISNFLYLHRWVWPSGSQT
jgi:hypothetical protein